jgi:hypothetical protein
LLATLVEDGCLILNDVPFPYGNLDHIVVRPDKTIFLIETKAHKGRVTCNGKELLINGRPFARNPICQMNRGIRWVRHPEAEFADKHASGHSLAKQFFGTNPWIVAVLVFPNATVSVRRPVKRINVITAQNLPAFIRSYPEK